MALHSLGLEVPGISSRVRGETRNIFLYYRFESEEGTVARIIKIKSLEMHPEGFDDYFMLTKLRDLIG